MTANQSPTGARAGIAFIGAFAALKLVLHLMFIRWYGYHHDELYFLACGHHLAFGYVDHPPFTPWMAALSDALFGQSLSGLRFFPALAGAGAVFVTGLLTRRMGGGRFAQAAACLAMIGAPVFLRTGNVLTIPSFETFFWVLCAYLAVRIVQDDNPKLWLWVGLVAGIGLMNKHTMAFFGFGLVVGLLLTPHRKHLKSPWLYAGGVVALLIFLPNLIWQMQHDWLTVQFIRHLNANVMSDISRPQFVLGQLLYLHPFFAPMWIVGLVFLMFREAGKPFRILGWVYVSVFVVLFIVKSKIYYLAPAYPVLFAAGAMAFERFAEKPGRAWIRPATLVVLSLGGVLFAPVALPMLSIEATDRYINAITFGALGNVYELTGDLHGQFGWAERVAGVAEVCAEVPEPERARTVIFTDGYGTAGAIDYFGVAYGLPKVICPHMTYHVWGTGDGPIDTVVAAGVSRRRLEQFFDEVGETRVFQLERVNPWDKEFPVTICRKPKKPIEEIWPELGPF